MLTAVDRFANEREREREREREYVGMRGSQLESKGETMLDVEAMRIDFDCTVLSSFKRECNANARGLFVFVLLVQDEKLDLREFHLREFQI